MSNNAELNDKEGEKSAGGNTSRERYRIWVWGMVIGNAPALILLWLFANGIQEYKDWAALIVVGLLSLSSLDVVIISALTSREMVEIMDRQETEMTEQRRTMQGQLDVMREGIAETQRLLAQNERAIRTSQRQARAAEKSLELSAEMFYVSERAYLGIVGLEITGDIGNMEDPLKMVCTVLNTGKTPAHKVAVMIGAAFEPLPLVDNYSRPPIPPTPNGLPIFEILPNVPNPISGPVPVPHRRPDDAQMVRNGQLRLLIYGELRYETVRNRSEVYPFAYVYNPDSPTRFTIVL